MLSPLLFNIFFAAVIIVVRQRFAEDPLTVSDLERTLEMVRRAVWGMLHADDAGVVSTSPRGLTRMMAIMSFAGFCHARFLLSVFFPVCLSCFVFFPTVFVPDLLWCNFLYNVTTAEFVADQLIM